MATMGRLSRMLPVDPRYRASPNANTPPSLATSQYPRPAPAAARREGRRAARRAAPPAAVARGALGVVAPLPTPGPVPRAPSGGVGPAAAPIVGVGRPAAVPARPEEPRRPPRPEQLVGVGE